MRSTLARLLRIGPGEARLAGALFAIMLLTSIGAGAGATAADALLFARFGVEALPQLYLALGIVSFICALGVSVLFGRARRERVYPVALGALVVVLVALRLAVLQPGQLAYPVLWLGASVVVTFQGIVAWGVASWLCDARQAKRLFPLANAAKILGVIVGSAAVAPLVLLVRLEDLFVLWALTLAATLAIVLRLARGAPAAPIERREGSLRDELLSGFRIVRASALLRWLAIALVLFSLLFFALALPFTRAARAAMPREDELASFLGLFNASTTAVAFLASLFVANRFYARFGVVNAILGFTLIYLAGFVVLVVTDSFFAVAAVRWIQLAWLAGMADAAYQALFNPVPAERRDQMRAFMEGVPGQAGIALAGVLLLLGDRALDPRAVAIGGVVAAAATTAVIWRTRGAYREALVSALRAGRPEPFLGAERHYAMLRQDRAALDVIRAEAASADPAARRASVAILAELGGAESVPTLLGAARDPDTAVRVAALRGGARLAPRAFVDAARETPGSDGDLALASALVLANAGEADGAEVLRAASRDATADLRVAAARALGESGLPDANDLLAKLGRDADRTVRRAALASLAARDPSRARKLCDDRLWKGDDIALEMLEQLPEARISGSVKRYAEDARGTAVRYVAFRHSLADDDEGTRLLRVSLDRRVRDASRRAVRASAILSGRVAPPALLDGLDSADGRVRADALETLESYVAPDLARALVPIWEDRSAAVDLRELLHDADAWIRDCATYVFSVGGDGMPLATLTLIERVVFLHNVPLFSRLDPSDIQAIARVATERALGDGEIVFHQGDRGDALYVVTSGALRISQDGREIARRGRGEIVGEMAIVRDAPRVATVDASGESKTLRIARADFESILRDRPETALGVIQVLATRLVEATAAR